MKASFRLLFRFIVRYLSQNSALRHQRRLYNDLSGEFQRSRGEAERLNAEILDRNARIEALEVVAAFDPLTGLYNRYGAANELNRTLGAFGRQDHDEIVQHQLSALVMDLNQFKLVNDRFGHAAGDAVLVAVAEHLRKAFRPDDIIFRSSTAGDEFTAYLVNATKGNAVGIAERLRQRLLEDPRLRFGDIQVSISIGISHGTFSSKRGGLQIVSDVEKLADAAMYGAKEDSRDFSGIVVAPDAVYSDTVRGDL